jgi:hypothetical protein
MWGGNGLNGASMSSQVLARVQIHLLHLFHFAATVYDAATATEHVNIAA